MNNWSINNWWGHIIFPNRHLAECLFLDSRLAERHFPESSKCIERNENHY